MSRIHISSIWLFLKILPYFQFRTVSGKKLFPRWEREFLSFNLVFRDENENRDKNNSRKIFQECNFLLVQKKFNENLIFQNEYKNIFNSISCFEMRMRIFLLQSRLIGKNDFTGIPANENSRHSLVQNNFHFPGRCFTLMKHLFKATRINLFSALQTSE